MGRDAKIFLSYIKENDYMTINDAVILIKERLNSSAKALTVAIDGRCASGKTTFAALIKQFSDCNVIHLDDFFLQPEQRTSRRLDTPGGNFDKERFIDEVITGINSGSGFTYHRFDCSTMKLGEEIHVKPKPLTIIEGSYSCHPDISRNWDMKFFVTTDKITQKERIEKRNPDKAETFFSKWIPLEEKYFEHFRIEENSDYIIKT